MNIGELIEQLKKFDPELTVCLADWNEEYAKPREDVAEILRVITGAYYSKDHKAVTGQFLQIGSDEVSWHR